MHSTQSATLYLKVVWLETLSTSWSSGIAIKLSLCLIHKRVAFPQLINIFESHIFWKTMKGIIKSKNNIHNLVYNSVSALSLVSKSEIFNSLFSNCFNKYCFPWVITTLPLLYSHVHLISCVHLILMRLPSMSLASLVTSPQVMTTSQLECLSRRENSSRREKRVLFSLLLNF